MEPLRLFGLLAIAAFVGAIDERSAEESSCFKPKVVELNETWAASVPKWYYPLASRLDLYRSVHDLLATDYENIPEYSLYYDACLEWTLQSDGYTVTGYNGKKRRLATTPVADGVADFKSEWSQGMRGRAYTTLTDNKTFMFFAACFEDNQMTWNLFSTSRTLDPATKEKIFEHAETLGYNSEYFTELRYDSCRDQIKSAGPNPLEQIFRSNLTGAPPTASSITGEDHVRKPEHGFYFCSACLKMCPNIQARNPVAERYFRKLELTKRIDKE